MPKEIVTGGPGLCYSRLMPPGLGRVFACATESGRARRPVPRRSSHHRITIYPRHLGPNAKRQCRAWLAKEYRVSGPVIVPRQQCWWE